MPATQDEIASKFLEMAFRYGYRRTSIEDVARALRISKKTIYDYFPSKEALLVYALELSASEQRRRVESMLTERTALGRMTQVATAAFADARRFYESQPARGHGGAGRARGSGECARVRADGAGPRRRRSHRGRVRGTGRRDDRGFRRRRGHGGGRMIRDDPSSRPEAAALDAMRRLSRARWRKI